MRKRHAKDRSDPTVKWIVENELQNVPTKSEHRRLASGTESVHKSVMQLRTIPITWGIPMDELMFSKFFTNFLHLNIMPWDSVITTESTYLPDARNYVHEIFVTQYQTNYLFMLDSDVLPPPNIIDVLLKHDKPIVGGWYHKKESFEIKDIEGNPKMISRPVIYDWSRESEGKYWFHNRMQPGQGVEKVDGIGAGCLMMRRDLAEKLGERPYDMNAGGEDLVLCKKIRDLDVPIYVDWDMACAHVGVSYI